LHNPDGIRGAARTTPTLRVVVRTRLLGGLRAGPGISATPHQSGIAHGPAAFAVDHTTSLIQDRSRSGPQGRGRSRHGPNMSKVVVYQRFSGHREMPNTLLDNSFSCGRKKAAT
jgi:hypothetical protein